MPRPLAHILRGRTPMAVRPPSQVLDRAFLSPFLPFVDPDPRIASLRVVDLAFGELEAIRLPTLVLEVAPGAEVDAEGLVREALDALDAAFGQDLQVGLIVATPGDAFGDAAVGAGVKVPLRRAKAPGRLRRIG